LNDRPKIDFPCDYPLKVIGLSKPTFEASVIHIVQHHCPEFDADSITPVPSRNGKYASLRFNINAQSEDHIRQLFTELKAHELVQMVL